MKGMITYSVYFTDIDILLLLDFVSSVWALKCKEYLMGIMKTLLPPYHFFTVQVCSGGNGKGWTHIRWGSEYSSWSWHLQASCYSRYKCNWSTSANHFQWLLFWFHVCLVVMAEYLLCSCMWWSMISIFQVQTCKLGHGLVWIMSIKHPKGLGTTI